MSDPERKGKAKAKKGSGWSAPSFSDRSIRHHCHLPTGPASDKRAGNAASLDCRATKGDGVDWLRAWFSANYASVRPYLLRIYLAVSWPSQPICGLSSKGWKWMSGRIRRRCV